MNSIILVGISGSLKSTFTKQYIKENPSYISVNRDSLRASLFTTLEGYYQHSDLRKREEFVTTIADAIIYKAFFKDKNVVIDATNLNKEYLLKTIQILESLGNVYFKFFDVELLEAKKRVLCRDYGFNPEWLNPNSIEYQSDIYIDSLPPVKYIEKQFQQYKEIKKWIMENYSAQKILNM